MSPRAPQPNLNPLLPPKHIGCESGVYPNAHTCAKQQAYYNGK